MSNQESKGELIATALTASWRTTPPPLQISEQQLKSVAPLLLKSGAAALCWRRVRQSELQNSVAGGELQQVHRLQTLQARIDEQKIEAAIKLFRAAGTEPILVKGWAIARLYPERGVRPYGDIDLSVRPADYVRARALIKTREGWLLNTDLHCGFENLGGGDWDQLFGRSEMITLGETEVRVLAPEDHFRVLCFHMLREGAWRPLWLCDIATALENRPVNFDWEKCFSANTRSRELVACAVALAHRLLGAEIEHTPFSTSPEQLPKWVVPTVHKEWESSIPAMSRRHSSPAVNYFQRPLHLRSAFTDRWPNPVEASVVARAPFNDFPRLPFQFGAYVIRAFGFLRRLPSLWRATA